ncbi:SusD/RagB family nutrient-binding outer membrane lipoprotein [Cytophagaceae bacterium YF14B1]|uniref:SusD/RagB family nutrient-binding outer membrane lipoprotein n=1 Tax=Xanthocytophaga flava TaxID=3048013 RepID=A0AAE3QS42_9BACT|nr:SusD/RagB family nutrient-binding outer membrane lipoprotein [Xanthocytophaga flavus]MDJ1482201.1 SusD/RagB family nutrient-binding outer membrane lipoprotein [Xanthocytophaga flavus]
MKKIYISAVLILLTLVSCEKNFDEFNKNTNDPTSATAESLLPHGIESAVDLYMGNATYSLGMDVGNLWPQHWARIQYVESDQYNIPSEVIDQSWRDFYTESLADFNKINILGQAAGNENYQAIAIIMRSWVFQLLTDIYGDIPYTEALKGSDGAYSPVYDSQKDVYAGLVADLKSASDMINTKAVSSTGDILFAGNMSKWKKFANSLSLRILIRMIGKTDASIDVNAEITRILSNPETYPVFTSKSDMASLAYLAQSPSNNPINENRKTRDDHRISKTMVDKLKLFNDARLAVYANKPEAGGDYVGLPNGLNAADANSYGLAKTSKIGSYFTAATAPGVLMSYAELLFIKAEAAYNGITAAGDVETNYIDAIKASHEQFSLVASDTYLSGIAYKGGEEGYTQIMEQKWIALFGQGLEAWAEQRRSGIPALTAPVSNFNDNIVPTRLPYPSSEEALNSSNFANALSRQGGENDKKLKLWFEQE